MTVADATPLIALARIQRLEWLRELYDQVLIGPLVQAETIDAGRFVRALGVEQIEAAVDDGWLTIARSTDAENDLMQRLTQRSRLHRGEAESIALARVRELPLVVDDKEARSVARAVGVRHLGTVSVLLQAHLRHGLGPDAMEGVLLDLGKTLWLSPSVVAGVLRRARKAQK